MEGKVPHLLPRFMQLIWLASIAFVAYLSLRSRVEFSLGIKNIDKVYHLLAYLWLAAVPFFAFSRRKVVLTSAFLMLPMGIALEYAQDFVPERSFSMGDMAANGIGVMVGITLGMYLKSRFFSVLLISQRVEGQNTKNERPTSNIERPTSNQ